MATEVKSPSQVNGPEASNDRITPSSDESKRLGRQSTAAHSSCANDFSEIEPFDDYKHKIEQLLTQLELKDFSIEAIQHGYSFENCVYGLTSLHDANEQYILRVALNAYLPDPASSCKAIENDIVLLNFLCEKLPVPRIKAYCTTKNNVLELPYTIQTRIPGTSLNHVWGEIDYTNKYSLVDDFINLVVKIESLEFPIAGSFAISTPLPAAANDFCPTPEPSVRIFDEVPPGPTQDAKELERRTGSDIKSLLSSHLNMYMEEEISHKTHEYPHSMTPLYKSLLTMLEEMDTEGYFEGQPHRVVLHHWDLEPRNIMVAQDSETGTWRICSVIDWDDAVAVPQPLARMPPIWIWHFPDEDPTGHWDDDQYPDPELSEGDRKLKSYFDVKVENALPGYGEDAYGRGRWLRRIWSFARKGVYREYERDFVVQLTEDWAARPKPIKCEPTQPERKDWLKRFLGFLGTPLILKAYKMLLSFVQFLCGTADKGC